MPRRNDIRKILLLGSGPIVIGQACEFDYSGTQGAKALTSLGYDVVLVNSNPATIMTDPELVRRTYVEPLTVETVSAIIERERPDALLPTLGGQTALNLALELHDQGVLSKHGVQLIGAQVDAIRKAEDRILFKDAMTAIGLESPVSAHCENLQDALAVVEKTGYPVILRPSFTMGGSGGAVVENAEQLGPKLDWALQQSPTHQVLVEESLIGWKEYELEVIRDSVDNFIVICSIENIDPMGVHTGDSITVAPSMTLTDREFQRLRDAARGVMTEIGVETGGSNVQFAIDPKTGRVLVIEMNPRVSRSSALASKATGYPIAKIAAKLAVGFTLDELENDITGTSAAFEPTIDYVIVKWPRFAFEKFPGADARLGTQMKSVGEVMSIGRTFPEALQKAARSLETGKAGFVSLFDRLDYRSLAFSPDAARDLAHDAPPLAKPKPTLPPPSGDELWAALEKVVRVPTAERLFYVGDALRHGISPERLNAITGIDPWFLAQLARIVQHEQLVQKAPSLDADLLRESKRLGFSDVQLANLRGQTPEQIFELRDQLGVRAVYARVDTCAAEFPAKTIMVNCNPETVSTDYDTSDRLYFEPLTLEDVLAICREEASKGELLGVIVQFGGQTPLKLSVPLERAGIKLLGTSADAIDRAEDRERFDALLSKLNLKRPRAGIARSIDEARKIVTEIGFPVLVRPSYVLGGRAMMTCWSDTELEAYVQLAIDAAREEGGSQILLIDQFLKNATEVDVDVVCDGKRAVIGGVMQHIEEAGVHSGDSTSVLPPHTLDSEVVARIEEEARALALEIGVVGLMNVQFAVKDRQVYVLEVNPRASRTVPFVAKATGRPLAKIAAKVMVGKTLDELNVFDRALPMHVAVKESVFPFQKFPGVDTILGPEMRSTGEVMGIAGTFPLAFGKSLSASGVRLPDHGIAFISVKDDDKEIACQVARRLRNLGFSIMATGGTATAIGRARIPVERVNKVLEGSPHVVDAIRDARVQLVINTTQGAKAIADSYSIRRNALLANVPYFTTMAAGAAAVDALEVGALLAKRGELVKSLQEWHSRSAESE
jgi:carbamoyl-phosphate synthase large subunit